MRTILLKRAIVTPARSFSWSIPRFAATATASSPSETPTPTPSSPASTTKKYVRKVPTSASASTTTSASTRPSYARSPVKATAEKSPSSPATAAAKAAEEFNDFDEEVDHSIPDISAGIDDYANLTPPSPTIVRRPRLPPTTPAATLQPAPTPTPSPPMTALPIGISTLPLIEPIRQPDNMGEAAVGQDWSTSFAGLGQGAFPKEVGEALLKPLAPADVEVKPDGLLYLPEIKYRRTLNAAFGPGGWGLAPRGETNVGPRIVSREWGLVAMGRLVSVARGEQEYFDPSGIPTATEACKSNALMRCCKDLGIASELWDPRFIREFKAKHCAEVFTEHIITKKKKKMWRKKDGKFEYPYKET